MTNVALGAAAGAALLVVLSRGRLRRRVRPVRGLGLAAAGAVEEVFWRGIVLSRLAGPLGLPAALALTTVAFAAAHLPLFGPRAAVHLVTGGVFGALLLGTGSLKAAVAGHAAYNGMLAVGRRDVVVRLRRLEKRLGGVEALRGVDLEIQRGEIVALLGPNGAGKTTLVSLVMGLRRPDAGTVELTGSAGLTPQGMGFPPTARVREILDFALAHYPRAVPAQELIERFELQGLERRQAGALSGGQQRRLAVALAFAGSPDLAVLDEPTTGLDVEARRAVWDAVRAFADGGGAVLLTTHLLDEARALADRIAVIAEGRIVAETTPDGLPTEERLLELIGTA